VGQSARPRPRHPLRPLARTDQEFQQAENEYQESERDSERVVMSNYWCTLGNSISVLRGGFLAVKGRGCCQVEYWPRLLDRLLENGGR
jgi:hypothetical protein